MLLGAVLTATERLSYFLLSGSCYQWPLLSSLKLLRCSQGKRSQEVQSLQGLPQCSDATQSSHTLKATVRPESLCLFKIFGTTEATESQKSLLQKASTCNCKCTKCWQKGSLKFYWGQEICGIIWLKVGTRDYRLSQSSICLESTLMPYITSCLMDP